MSAARANPWPRLLAAYEELVEAEAFQAHAGDARELVATQQRMTPLVERLLEMAGTADAAIGARLAALAAMRRETGALLTTRLEQLRGELGEVRRRERQVARFAPVYRGTMGRAARLVETV